ncbi:MAG: hypothetical protein ACI4SR_01655 [Faecalibacillus sp.]
MKKIKKIMILCFMSLLLTACVQLNITIDFSDGESAMINSELLIKESDLKTNQLTIKDIKKQIQSNDDLFKNWSIKDISKTIDNEKYKGISIQSPDTINEELAKKLTSHEENKQTTYEFNINFQESGLDLSELTHYQTTIKTLKNNNASFELYIIMPGKVIESSIGTIDGNVVTVDLYDYFLSGHIPPISIISQTDNIDDSFYLYIFVGFIIIIMICFVYHLTRKKRKKDI